MRLRLGTFLTSRIAEVVEHTPETGGGARPDENDSTMSGKKGWAACSVDARRSCDFGSGILP